MLFTTPLSPQVQRPWPCIDLSDPQTCLSDRTRWLSSSAVSSSTVSKARPWGLTLEDTDTAPHIHTESPLLVTPADPHAHSHWTHVQSPPGTWAHSRGERHKPMGTDTNACWTHSLVPGGPLESLSSSQPPWFQRNLPKSLPPAPPEVGIRMSNGFGGVEGGQNRPSAASLSPLPVPQTVGRHSWGQYPPPPLAWAHVCLPELRSFLTLRERMASLGREKCLLDFHCFKAFHSMD